MYKTKSSSRNINMKSQINIIATMTTLDFISYRFYTLYFANDTIP